MSYTLALAGDLIDRVTGRRPARCWYVVRLAGQPHHPSAEVMASDARVLARYTRDDGQLFTLEEGRAVLVTLL